MRDSCETDTLNLFAAYVPWAASTGRTDAFAHDETIGATIAYLGSPRAARSHLGRFLDAWFAEAGCRTAFIAPSRIGPDTGRDLASPPRGVGSG